MNTGLAILFIIIALILGAVGGFFLAKKTFEDQLQKNPPVNEDMLRMMMSQMGQKPSEKKIRQMMQNMTAQNNKKKK
ncbi:MULTISPECIES: YneF family protein [Enterococcaceae]|uniref:UPF0154 protein BHY08_05510 n=4 Tax=Vagococcus TaxID=2737 RepID=A0A1J0A5X1_9ENTE|nr:MULTISPECIES: YneF family protein [Enterococcaceae]APB31331.1 hypothetical protein BHY08_05510 [Vagococcus teuberi]MCI0129878.1 YneF family protein [Vagococcus sp. CY53-2]OPF86714.1 hypothetical protein BW731_00140 [Vagococcus martis]RGI30752.1 YneF family protein [Melissococcus sp. OM08-11BH]RHH71105.1 YneF family protein [Vagococcus sp. AM17-17]